VDLSKLGIIIQARTGSSRFPKKIFEKINGISVIQSHVNQLKFSKFAENLIIATTNKKDDELVVKFAIKNNLDYFCGDENDVLDRYYNCAKKFKLSDIIRVSSDAPLIDPKILDKTTEYYLKNDYDYVSNFYQKTFPIGNEVEIFHYNVLENCWKFAEKPSEREHVTPYIYNNPKKFNIGFIKFAENLSHLHWTIDRKEDLIFVKEIYSRIKNRPILLEDILKILKRNKKILKINSNINPNEGYLESLIKDQENKSNHK
jgi:spore coat polysaccharide biosynthesis protein SpsF